MFDVVIQGPTNSRLEEVIDSYRHPSVSKIIYSGWEDDPDINLPADIQVIKSNKPALAGGGNVNYQLTTSKAGAFAATGNYVLKTRSDLILSKECLDSLETYYTTNGNKILTLGIASMYAFFTWDFIYFGSNAQVKLLFNSPLDPNPNYYPDLAKAIIPETYITVKYIANFRDEVARCCNDPENCLVQHRAGYNNILRTLSKLHLKDYFYPMPPTTKVFWTKAYSDFDTTINMMRKFGRSNDIFGDT